MNFVRTSKKHKRRINTRKKHNSKKLTNKRNKFKLFKFTKKLFGGAKSIDLLDILFGLKYNELRYNYRFNTEIINVITESKNENLKKLIVLNETNYNINLNIKNRTNELEILKVDLKANNLLIKAIKNINYLIKNGKTISDIITDYEEKLSTLQDNNPNSLVYNHIITLLNEKVNFIKELIKEKGDVNLDEEFIEAEKNVNFDEELEQAKEDVTSQGEYLKVIQEEIIEYKKLLQSNTKSIQQYSETVIKQMEEEKKKEEEEKEGKKKKKEEDEEHVEEEEHEEEQVEEGQEEGQVEEGHEGEEGKKKKKDKKKKEGKKKKEEHQKTGIKKIKKLDIGNIIYNNNKELLNKFLFTNDLDDYNDIKQLTLNYNYLKYVFIYYFQNDDKSVCEIKGYIRRYSELPKEQQKSNPIESLTIGELTELTRDITLKIKPIKIKPVFENDYVKIYMPKTEEEAIKLGKGTRWCTAGISNNMFTHYNSQGQIYTLHKKYNTEELKEMREEIKKAKANLTEEEVNLELEQRKEKYQFHIEAGQFMDKTDKSIKELDKLIKDLHIEDVFIMQKYYIIVNLKKYISIICSIVMLTSKQIIAFINKNKEDDTYISLSINNMYAGLEKIYRSDKDRKVITSTSLFNILKILNKLVLYNFDEVQPNEKLPLLNFRIYEYIPNLDTLLINDRKIIKLNLSQNTKLKKLVITNKLYNIDLDLSKNTELEYVMLKIDKFNKPLNLSNSIKLEYLELISDYFNQELDLSNCKKLEKIILIGQKFNSTLQLPTELKEFGADLNVFNQELDLSKFSNLKKLTFIGKNFDKKYNTDFKLPTGIKDLILYLDKLDQELDLSKFENLEMLNFKGKSYNSPLILPTGLKKLILNLDIFNQELDLLKYKKLEKINFTGGEYNKDLKLSTELKYIALDLQSFNQELDLSEFENLKYFDFIGNNFNSVLKVPIGLEKFGSYLSKFNKDLDFSQNTQLYNIIIRLPVFNNIFKLPKERLNIEKFAFVCINYDTDLDISKYNIKSLFIHTKKIEKKINFK